MILLGDNLAARMTAILLGSILALALLVGGVLFWPRAYDTGTGGLFELPVPEETAAIVTALEASPPPARPLVLRALNTSAVSVHIEKTFPPVPMGLHRATDMEWMFAQYSRVLAGRPFRVEMRKGALPIFADGWKSAATVPIRLSVQLKDGSVLVVDRQPSAFIRSYIARLAAVSAVGALILILGLLLAIRQTARPVGRLALAARRFSIEGRAMDLPISGPRELRDLSVAFNDMQHRIRGLVEDRTRVLAAIAHDLRTYLTRLRLRAEFISDYDQRARAERDITEMSLLLDDTLLFAQQTSRPSAEPALLDAATEVEAFVAQRRELDQPVEIQVNSSAGDCQIRCDQLALRRMLGNLTDNAIRYGSVAHIEVGHSTTAVTIAVSDEGPGIPEGELQRLTKPFERLEGSRTRETGGAGLGLAIVKALAESAGATLGIENTIPTGLTVTLEFPLTKPSAYP